MGKDIFRCNSFLSIDVLQKFIINGYKTNDSVVRAKYQSGVNYFLALWSVLNYILSKVHISV